MSYIYVKSGGTATGTAGKYDIVKTGSWSTAFTNVDQYYGSIFSAYSAVGFNPGDVICVSHIHSYSDTNTSARVINGNNIKIVSVNDVNITQPLVGASERNRGSYNLYFSSSRVYGLSIGRTSTYEGGFSIYSYNNTNTCYTIWENCRFYGKGSNSLYYYNSVIGGTYYDFIIFKNCTFDLGTSSTSYPLGLKPSVGYLYFINCTFLSATSTSGLRIFRDASERLLVHLIGCDFSSCNRGLIGSAWSQSNGLTQLIAEGCILGSNAKARPSYTNFEDYDNFEFPNSFYSCSGTTTPGDYISIYNQYASIESITSIYKDGGAVTFTNTPYSLRVTGLAFPESGRDLIKFKLVELVVDVTELTEFRIDILQPNSSATLNSSEIWVELIYPDSTSTKGNFVSSEGYLLSNNPSYPFSSATWTGLSGPVAQYIPITTTITGKKGLCSIWMYISKPSKTIYVCPKITIKSIT